MKRKLALLLAVCMMAALFAGCELFGPKQKVGGQIIAGSTTELESDWEGTWQNNGADASVRRMTTGYATVAPDKNGQYVWDTKNVVKSHKETETPNAADPTKNDKTFEIEIFDDLVYNDGSKITAKDYVARIALFSSPIIKAMGNRATSGMNYVGYQDFVSGKSKVFTGVRLLGEYKFSVTVDAEYLPYYYDITNASVYPCPMKMWLPDDVDLKDDGQGVYFTGNLTLAETGEGQNQEEGVPEAIRNKIKEARFLSQGRVSSGPYNIESFDASAKTATLVINENYKGNFEGQKPHVAKIVFVRLVQDTMMDALKTGQIDILTQIGDGDSITAGLDMVDAGGFAYSTYDRAGYGLLSFSCDFGPTQFAAVRHAIAHLLDRNEFARAFTKGFGTVVHGPYGTAMAEYKEAKTALDEKLNTYAFNKDKAIELLVADGWTLNDKGETYTTGVRYKEVTEEQAGTYAFNVKLADGRILMPLHIEWLSTEKNAVSDLLKVHLVEGTAIKEAGMEIKQTSVSFPELQSYKERDASKDPKYGVPTYGMFNLATGYPTALYDQSYEWTRDPELLAQGYNTERLMDEQMDKLSMDMVYGVKAGDRAAFMGKWIEYILRWNELLPQIPLYSNLYHEFYNAKLKNYNPSPYFTFDSAIIYANVE